MKKRKGSKLTNRRLKYDAIPCWFQNCPFYLLRQQPDRRSGRTTTHACFQEEYCRTGNMGQQVVEADNVTSIEEIKAQNFSLDNGPANISIVDIEYGLLFARFHFDYVHGRTVINHQLSIFHNMIFIMAHGNFRLPLCKVDHKMNKKWILPFLNS
nr:uncharacterized protein LOC121121314 isoform X1 [Lepeophtheirus salmonis]